MKVEDKPKLKTHLKSMMHPLSNTRLTNTTFVLDGGCILPKIQWVVGQTFGEICEAYFYLGS